MKPPRRNPNLVLRYKGEHPWCELLGYLQGSKWERKIREYNAFFKVRCPEHWPVNTLELHHIFQGKDRYDIWPNIIHISAAAHSYAHQNPIQTKVCCLYVKHLKGELNEESLSLMHECFGFHPIGRMESWDVKDDWVLEMRDELLERYLDE